MTTPDPTTRRSTSWARIALPVIGAVLLTIIGIATVTRDDGHATPSNADYDRAFAGLCAAAADAERGDDIAANNTFFDESHTSLHVLAADVEDRDRPAAATLLEAKNKVETALAVSDDNLAATLDALIDETRIALVLIDEPDPGACS